MQRPSQTHAMARQLAFPAAVVCALCVLLMTLLAGMATPGYSHAAQFISELGAAQAAYEYPVRFFGFLPAGIALLAFCGFAHASLPKSGLTTAALGALALYALGYVAAAFFPCDLGCRPSNPSASQIIHNLVGGIGYLLAPGLLFALALSARSWPASAPLAALGFIAAGIAVLGLLTLSPLSPYVGWSQRAIEASVLGWAIACGWYLRAPRPG